MESSGNLYTDLVNDFGTRFIELKTKARTLEERMRLLGKEEGEVGELYRNIFQAVYVQLGFFLTFSSCLVALYIKDVALYWMFAVIASVILSFIIGVICPIGFAYRQLSGLNYTCKKLIEERANIQVCCVSLLNEYTGIFVFVTNLNDNENCVSNNDDHQSKDLEKDELLSDVIEFQMEKLEEFTKEDILPKFRNKHNRKYILTIGLCCLMFTMTVLLYAVYKTKSQVVPSPSPTPSSPPVLSHGSADDIALLYPLESELGSLPRLLSDSK